MKHIHRTLRAWLVCMLAMLAALPASADVTPDQLEFTEVEGGYSVKANYYATLEDTLVIPETYNGKPVVKIGEWAFSNCSGLTSVTIPDGVTTIGENAFYGCSGLTSVTIPDAVTTIGSNAFASCTGLTSVTIPDGVTSIKTRTFYGCSGLTSVTIGNAVTTIENYAFCDCSSLTSVTIGNAVTTIEDYAFQNCTGLTSVTIPDAVTTIGSRAFQGCKSLTQINVDKANLIYCSIEGVLYNLYNNAPHTLLRCPEGFQGELIIPDAVTGFWLGAFQDCTGLTSVTIGNGVTTIGVNAFYGCTGLTSVTIPDGVTSIGKSAFAKCSTLSHIVIPAAVTSIGDYAFEGCTGLTKITVDEANQSYCSIDNILYDKSKDSLLCFPGGNHQGEFPIPEFVKVIGNSAFWGCSGLTGVNIPNTVTSIGNYAFSNCTNLTRVKFGKAMRNIGTSAFYNCNLAQIDIPDSVITIENGAFYGCGNLKEIICRAVTPPVIYSETYTVYENAILYVPEESVEAYRQHRFWGQFKNIVGKDLTGVGSIETDAAEAGAMEIYGLDGVRHPEGIKKLRPGNYVVRQGGRSRKIHVR